MRQAIPRGPSNAVIRARARAPHHKASKWPLKGPLSGPLKQAGAPAPYGQLMWGLFRYPRALRSFTRLENFLSQIDRIS